MPAIRELTARAGIEIRGLEAIFIARGPGGFSALRVGMSTAKAIAVSLAIPLVAVGTLDLEVAPYLGLGYPVCGVIGAGRTRVYVGGYGIGEEPKYDVVSTEEFLSTVQPDHLYCGEGVHELASELRQRLGSEAKRSVQSWTWDDTARQTLAIYERVLDGAEQTPKI